jgi:adenine-specific DNA methylase
VEFEYLFIFLSIFDKDYNFLSAEEQLGLFETNSPSGTTKDNCNFTNIETFRTIHYLGSKLRILDFIKEITNEIDPGRGAVCDLFAGSGVVSQILAHERRIIAVDIQEYSRVICSALLMPKTGNELSDFETKFYHSSYKRKLSESLRPIIDYESFAMLEGHAGNFEPICDLLENGSLYGVCNESHYACSPELATALKNSIRSVAKLQDIPILATTYFGGIYFSYKQTLEIDSILNVIRRSPVETQDLQMAALLCTASDLVNTVGKQFAQPIRPRDKNGLPKSSLLSQLAKDRSTCVHTTFHKWMEKYSRVQLNSKKHSVLRMDYKDALDRIPEDVTIVYADPPYTRDHYSRFYHVLETLCLYDFPRVSTTNIGGHRKLSRGLYRDKRHQSPFCIKSEAPLAFENLFQKVSSKGKILLLSYSPYDEKKKSHPRVMKIETIIAMAKKYFSDTQIYDPGVFAHRKLNSTEKHLEAEKNGELLIVCKT